jgi:hypothetical protein
MSEVQRGTDLEPNDDQTLESNDDQTLEPSDGHSLESDDNWTYEWEIDPPLEANDDKTAFDEKCPCRCFTAAERAVKDYFNTQVELHNNTFFRNVREEPTTMANSRIWPVLFRDEETRHVVTLGVQAVVHCIANDPLLKEMEIEECIFQEGSFGAEDKRVIGVRLVIAERHIIGLSNHHLNEIVKNTHRNVRKTLEQLIEDRRPTELGWKIQYRTGPEEVLMMGIYFREALCQDAKFDTFQEIYACFSPLFEDLYVLADMGDPDEEKVRKITFIIDPRMFRPKKPILDPGEMAESMEDMAEST